MVKLNLINQGNDIKLTLLKRQSYIPSNIKHSTKNQSNLENTECSNFMINGLKNKISYLEKEEQNYLEQTLYK